MRLVLMMVLAAALTACATSGRWSQDVSEAHLTALENLQGDALRQEAERVLAGQPSVLAPGHYVLYAFAEAALSSSDPQLRERGMVALLTAALPPETEPGYRLQPRAGQAPLVLPATQPARGLPEAQYRLYREWIGDPARETQALYLLMRAALAQYPPAVAAWNAEERAGRFDRGRR